MISNNPHKKKRTKIKIKTAEKRQKAPSSVHISPVSKRHMLDRYIPSRTLSYVQLHQKRAQRLFFNNEVIAHQTAPHRTAPQHSTRPHTKRLSIGYLKRPFARLFPRTHGQVGQRGLEGVEYGHLMFVLFDDVTQGFGHRLSQHIHPLRRPFSGTIPGVLDKHVLCGSGGGGDIVAAGGICLCFASRRLKFRFTFWCVYVYAYTYEVCIYKHICIYICKEGLSAGADHGQTAISCQGTALGAANPPTCCKRRTHERKLLLLCAVLCTAHDVRSDMVTIHRGLGCFRVAGRAIMEEQPSCRCPTTYILLASRGNIP